jgi:hypothetical protein
MALLRRVPFGQPVSPEHFIELGPARARLSDGKGSMGGPLEPGQYLLKGVTLPESRGPRLDSTIERERRQIAREAETRPRCPYILPLLEEQCARYVHGYNDHRSAEALRRDRLRRLARRV